MVARAPSKPFPDAVILRATGARPQLVVADHATEPYLAMSLGLDGDPAKMKTARPGNVSLAHAAHDGTIVGGFTLRPKTGR